MHLTKSQHYAKAFDRHQVAVEYRDMFAMLEAIYHATMANNSDLPRLQEHYNRGSD